ncbi:tetratricopeptide-like helical domain-containing protein [Heterostelium album PN500]|uniref:Tetratricopeptide-like helical domain-containing protein n=1 Tax=Heterostelium pallidum (strain ATCC 26659 / Pp 5 / PN500) TaxID=670386 RepID=D3BN92_HETP5|nr:tetratricopeptide-like helical domain-containing protein [Heterostelium album PN500]EFA76752.1 tetratricopeptide-like helical domain-containing protein [Heterostelium album PN500]|eukprot:XP_020428884.1 tetratricopeptide-like helical domain-containing protein [Heterostelium album PN500]
MNSFTQSTVIDKINQKIECIDTWEYRGSKKLFLGTYEGLVLVYDVVEKQTSVGTNCSLVIFDTKQLSRKPITQMTVLEPYNILVILTDGEIKVFDLLSGFSQRGMLNKAKGCNIYAISQNGSNLSLCAAVKKKLVLYSWDGTDFIEGKEFNIPDVTKTIDYRENLIVVNFKKAYNIINAHDGSVINIDTDKISYVTFFQDKEFLIVKNNMSFFINSEGTPNRKYALTWNDVPVSLTDIYVASNYTVWRLNPVPTMDLVEQLTSNNEHETAINVLSIAPDTLPGKREKLSKIKMIAAHSLFAREQYQSAMELYLSSYIDPIRVISQYPGFLPPLLQEKLSVAVHTKDIEKNENALSALETFLVGVRKELQKSDKPPYNLNPMELLNSGYDLPTLIDTTLLKVYIKLKPSLITIFFNLKNCLHIEESQRVLIEEKKFTELVSFYQSKSMHREALTLLAKNNPPKDTISYLCQLGAQYLPIILENSRWVLQKSTKDAMTVRYCKIFEKDQKTTIIFTTERKDELPPDQIIHHLEKYAPTFLMEYLEYIINNPMRPDTTPKFHNDLILEYLNKITTLTQDSLTPRIPGETVAGTEPGLLGVLRSKLINFLQTSKYYIPEMLLSRFPFTDLYEERAILLSRIGRHEQALAIYAHKLKNFKMAEDYCDRNYNRDNEDSKDVYLSLLNVYLKPEGNIQPLIEPALSLLNKHYRSINTPKALSLLPLSIPINQLYPFFEAVIRDNTKTKRDNQIIKNLLKAEHVKIKEELINLRSGVIKITDDLICPFCNKRFVGTNAFAAQPNGIAVHYVCFQNQQSKMNNMNNGTHNMSNSSSNINTSMLQNGYH